MTHDADNLDSDEDYDGSVGDAHAHEIEFLFAQSAGGVTVESGSNRINLNGVSPTTLLFSDRPDRVTGHIPTADFVEQWSAGEESFSDVPPNAVLSVFGEDEVVDVVVILTDPVLDGDDLSYGVHVTDGELVSSKRPVSLFIDQLGRPLTPMSVAGVRRRGRRRSQRRVRRRLR